MSLQVHLSSDAYMYDVLYMFAYNTILCEHFACIHSQMTGLMLQSSDGEPIAAYTTDDGIERGLCAFLLGILFHYNLDRVPAFTK